MIQSAFPILSTPDLARSLSFYRDLLGGTVSFQFPDEGEPGYVGIDLGSSHLGIGQDDAASAATNTAAGGPQRMSLWLYVDDCDEVVRTVAARGYPVVEPPTDQQWGERVARVEDPDGNTVIIGAR